MRWARRGAKACLLPHVRVWRRKRQSLQEAFVLFCFVFLCFSTYRYCFFLSVYLQPMGPRCADQGVSKPWLSDALFMICPSSPEIHRSTVFLVTFLYFRKLALTLPWDYFFMDQVLWPLSDHRKLMTNKSQPVRKMLARHIYNYSFFQWIFARSLLHQSFVLALNTLDLEPPSRNSPN